MHFEQAIRTLHMLRKPMKLPSSVQASGVSGPHLPQTRLFTMSFGIVQSENSSGILTMRTDRPDLRQPAFFAKFAIRILDSIKP